MGTGTLRHCDLAGQVPSDTVAALFKFAAEASQTTGLFDLRCGFPPRQLWPQKDLTLEEAKVHGEAIQMKQG